jgi:phosphatidate cytidylyltransferase
MTNGADTLATVSSLRQRTWTAFILGPMVMAAVLWLPAPAFAVFLALIVLIGGWEWSGLVGIEAVAARGAYVALLAAGMIFFWLQSAWQPWMIAVGAGWWVAQLIVLVRVRRVELRQGLDWTGAVVGLLVLIAPWVALVVLRQTVPAGPQLVLFLLLLIWIADSAAYFVGRRWGRAKLAPVLSPGKTRAGVYGALACACVGGLLLGLTLAPGVPGTLLAALACAMTVVVSIVGDLYESLLKRRRGVKDSGQLLPGHGGVLDRIDSLTAAAPVFTLGILLFSVVNP